MADGHGLRATSDKAQGKGLFATVMEDLGFVSENKNFPKDKHCVYKALYDANEWKKETGEDTLVAISKIKKTDKEDIDHAQAVVVRGDKFIPLTSHNNENGKVREWDWHYPDNQPYRYVPVDEFVAEQGKNLTPEFVQYIMGNKNESGYGVTPKSNGTDQIMVKKGVGTGRGLLKIPGE